MVFHHFLPQSLEEIFVLFCCMWNAPVFIFWITIAGIRCFSHHGSCLLIFVLNVDKMLPSLHKINSAKTLRDVGNHRLAEVQTFHVEKILKIMELHENC